MSVEEVFKDPIKKEKGVRDCFIRVLRVRELSRGRGARSGGGGVVSAV